MYKYIYNVKLSSGICDLVEIANVLDSDLRTICKLRKQWKY